MKYKKLQIRQIVLLLIVVVFAAPVMSGCSIFRIGDASKSVNMVDYPFERARKRAEGDEQKRKPGEEITKYGPNVQPTDRDIVSFSSEMIKVLGIEARNYRWIRKLTTTLGVVSGVIATSIHGAIGADADTVTMFAAAYTITPLLQQIWGAGEASQAKQQGIKLITEAQGRYYSDMGAAGGSVNNTRITTAGAQLYKEALAALTVVGDAIAKQIPSLEDLQTAKGVNALGMVGNEFALKIRPRRISMSKGVAADPAAVPAVTEAPSIRYISIIGDLAVTAGSDKPGIADVTKFSPNSKQIEITANTAGIDGVATISISNVKGQVANVFVKVGNNSPTANAGSNFTVNKGDPVILSGSQSTDLDGDKLTFLWSMKHYDKGKDPNVDPGSDFNLSYPASEYQKFNADKDGTYVAKLAVNDGTVSITTSVTITVQ